MTRRKTAILHGRKRSRLPRPHLPSGIALSWIGDGFSNPAFLSPRSTSSESNKEPKSNFSSVTTSSVRFFSPNLWAVRNLGMLNNGPPLAIVRPLAMMIAKSHHFQSPSAHGQVSPPCLRWQFFFRMVSSSFVLQKTWSGALCKRSHQVSPVTEQTCVQTTKTISRNVESTSRQQNVTNRVAHIRRVAGTQQRLKH